MFYSYAYPPPGGFAAARDVTPRIGAVSRTAHQEMTGNRPTLLPRGFSGKTTRKTVWNRRGTLACVTCRQGGRVGILYTWFVPGRLNRLQMHDHAANSFSGPDFCTSWAWDLKGLSSRQSMNPFLAASPPDHAFEATRRSSTPAGAGAAMHGIPSRMETEEQKARAIRR